MHKKKLWTSLALKQVKLVEILYMLRVWKKWLHSRISTDVNLHLYGVWKKQSFCIPCTCRDGPQLTIWFDVEIDSSTHTSRGHENIYVSYNKVFQKHRERTPYWAEKCLERVEKRNWLGIFKLVRVSGGLNGEESASQHKRHRSDPWVGKILWRRKWQSTPVFLPGEVHGQRSLGGYSPWTCGELVTTGVT